MINLKILITVVLAINSIFSCNDLEQYPEKVDRLRAIGVKTEKPAYSFAEDGSEVAAELQFIVASNIAEDLAFSTADLDESYLALNDLDAQYETFGGIQLVTITASTSLPSSDDPRWLNGFDGSFYISYGLDVSLGSDEEKIRGRLKVYTDSEIAEAITEPVIAITSPEDGQSINAGEHTLKAEISSANAEDELRVGWLVDGGLIERRRAIETQWTEITGGTRTVIVSVRGLQSLTFAYQIREVVVE